LSKNGVEGFVKEYYLWREVKKHFEDRILGEMMRDKEADQYAGYDEADKGLTYDIIMARLGFLDEEEGKVPLIQRIPVKAFHAP
jgi:hypothetical protein